MDSSINLSKTDFDLSQREAGEKKAVVYFFKETNSLFALVSAYKISALI